jgi:hypothetical protein
VHSKLEWLWFVLAPFSLAATALPALAQWQVDGVPTCTAASNQRYPHMVGDAAGGAIVTWMDHRNGTNFDIYAQRVNGAGVPQWSTDGVGVCTAAGDQGIRPASGDQGSATIVDDGAGGAIVTWYDSRGGSFTDDIYAQHVLASGAVDPAWPADGRALCTAAHDQVTPTIVSDRAGGAIVAWEDRRDGAEYHIYAQHVQASGAVDPGWPANGRALCTAATAQYSVTIVADRTGGAIVTWQDFRSSTTGYDIYAQHVLASGAVDPAWPANGRALCTAANSQYSPAIIADGSGGAIVTWYDYRGGIKYDIYAQHLLASGVVDPAWPADGRALCTAPGDQDFPAIVGDGASGAIISWEDHRSGGDYDIYAQHVQASGAVDPTWPADGRALCTAANSQYYPTIVADGSGGAVVAWRDQRDIYTHIYAQHVLASGAVDPVWPLDGRALCTAANSQDYATALGDGARGAIVAWEDSRTSGTTGIDIYAQRVYASGEVAAVPLTTTPTQLRLLAPYPNPSPGGSTKILFDLPSNCRVSAQVLDLAGHRVRTLAIDQEFSAGRQALEWDGHNDGHARVPAGVYFIRVRVGAHAEGRRLVLLD